MKEIEAYIIPDEVEGNEIDGVIHISHIYLAKPVIYFNENDAKETKKPYQKIKVINQ